MRPWFLVLAAVVSAAQPASAEMHEVKMLNRGAKGAMVFEPDYLRVEPGDTVKFLSTHRPHNAATIDGFVPTGAEPFTGNINEEIEVELVAPGFYGIKCSPHYDMGMVMLIEVGDASAEGILLPADMPADAEERFEAIIAERRGTAPREAADGAHAH